METTLQTYLSKLRLLNADIQPRKLRPGATLEITYEIESAFEIPFGIWLGASFLDATGKRHYSTKQDKQVSISPGVKTYQRQFTISGEVPLGTFDVGVNLWFGVTGDSSKSKWLQGNTSIKIELA